MLAYKTRLFISEAVLDVEMAMTNHFTAQHQNTAYNQKNTDNFFNNMFIQSVSTDFLEHTEGNAFLCSLTKVSIPKYLKSLIYWWKGVFDWCNMTNQMLDALPNLYSFPQTIDFFPQLNTTSDFLPIHHHMLESSEPVSSFLSDKEETNLSQFLMQMLPESAAVLPEKANAVDVHPVPDFSSGKVNEWEKTFKEQYGKWAVGFWTSAEIYVSLAKRNRMRPEYQSTSFRVAVMISWKAACKRNWRNIGQRTVKLQCGLQIILETHTIKPTTTEKLVWTVSIWE